MSLYREILKKHGYSSSEGPKNQLDILGHALRFNTCNQKEVAWRYVKEANKLFFNSTLPVHSSTWNLDGLTCVGKSSLSETMFKTNHHRKTYVGIDTCQLDAIGYFFRSMKDRINFCRPATYCDRSPFNNFLWEAIWGALAQHYANDQYLPLTKSYRELYFDGWFDHMPPLLKEMFAKSGGHIFIIDSNVENAKKRLIERNTGQDAHRAENYKLYIEAQNYIYSRMAMSYPEYICIIDLNVLGGDIKLLHEMIKLVKYNKNLRVVKYYNFAELVPNQAKQLFTDDEYKRFRINNLEYENDKWARQHA